MSALEVEVLLQKLAAVRDRGTGLEFQELYTLLEKVHAKVVQAEPLVNHRSSAAYSLFTADLRRVTIAIDEAIDKVSTSASIFSSTSSFLIHKLLAPLGNGGSAPLSSRPGRRTSRWASTQVPQSTDTTVYLQNLIAGPGRQLHDTLSMVRHHKIKKQFEEAQRDLRMLLRLFTSYVADLLPKHPGPLGVDDNTPLEETSSHAQEHDLIGREQDMENVLNKLRASGTKVVAIFGIAGVGKTAFTRELCKTAKDKGFDYPLFVTMSQFFVPERIFRDVMTALNEELQHGEDLESSWWSMKEGLVNKKYLVVLDNVWNEDLHKWNQLLHLLLSKKTAQNKIVVTTRVPAVADSIQFVTKYNLLPLSIEDSLRVLKTTAVNGFIRENNNASGKERSNVTKIIAERCSGLPKLLNFMKFILTEHTCQKEANHILEEFNRQCMNDKGLLYLAEASYHHLPSHLQQCFLYCSLFPLDHIFDSEEMTGLWVAEGLTQVSGKEAQVDTDLTKLLDECFVSCYESGCRNKMRYKMQYILHNFARNRAQSRGYKATKVEDYTSMSTESNQESNQYISLMVDHGTEDLPRPLIQQKDLRTLILLRKQEMVLHCQRSKIREIPSDYCRYLIALRVLDLHATKIDKLPDTFDMLSNLRYLNLSQTEIANLPKSFDKLQYLIHLNIAQTNIVAVPESIGKFKSLRYLNLSQTGVRELPDTFGDLRSLKTLQLSHCKKLVKLPHGIASLTNLQKLDLEGCHYLCEMPQDISNMKNLKELNILECSSLDRMPIGFSTLTKMEALPRYIAVTSYKEIIEELEGLLNLKILGLENLEQGPLIGDEKKWLEKKNKLESLTLHWNIHIEDTTAEAGQQNPHVQFRQENTSSDTALQRGGSETTQEGSTVSGMRKLIESLQPNEELKTLEIISYRGESFPQWITNGLPNLVEIRLVNVKCQRFPPLGELCHLAIAEISGMSDVKHVGSELNGQNGTFPSLKKLTFSQMFSLESWPIDGATCKCLNELSIIQCPKFKELSMTLPVGKLSVWMGDHELLSKDGLAGVAGSLEGLSISLCEELSSSKIEGLEELSSLKELEISGCDELKSLPWGMARLAKLESLSVIGCSKLCDLSSLRECTSLKSLIVSGCPNAKSVPELSKIPGLKQLWD